MAYVVNLTCPRCGASVSTEQKNCEYCHSPIVIEHLGILKDLDLNKYVSAYQNILQKDNDEKINSSLALCYLKLKFYDKAIKHFDLAIEQNINNPDMYFYYAIALLRGKKPFLVPLAEVKKVIELLNTAIMLEDKSIYRYLLAYVKYDFYARKFLNINPNYREELTVASQNINQDEIQELFTILQQDVPEQIRI